MRELEDLIKKITKMLLNMFNNREKNQMKGNIIIKIKMVSLISRLEILIKFNYIKFINYKFIKYKLKKF